MSDAKTKKPRPRLRLPEKADKPKVDGVLPRVPKVIPLWVQNAADRAEAVLDGKKPPKPKRESEAAPVVNTTPTAQPKTAEAVRGEVARLSALDRIEYDLARKDAAKSLGIRETTLDREVAEYQQAQARSSTTEALMRDIVPWAEPVDGAALLSELKARVLRHMVLPDASATAIALWIVHSHCIDAATHTPYLFISSPAKGCGKTTLMTLLKRITPRPLPAANVTAATVFRSIHEYRPTMLVDELDTFLAGKEELRGVFNSGHMREMAFVLRCVGPDLTPTPFSTWCAKVFGAIGAIPDTLEDRSICIKLQRRLPSEKVHILRAVMPGAEDPIAELAAKCARWASDNFQRLLEAKVKFPAEFQNRTRDNWRPLFAIAGACGEEWFTMARKAALALTAVNEDETANIVLLGDLRAIFDSEKAEYLKSSFLVDALVKMEDRPWGDVRPGSKKLTTNALVRMLKPFDVQPMRAPVTRGQGSVRVYRRAQLVPVFERYLPRGTGATTVIPSLFDK